MILQTIKTNKADCKSLAEQVSSYLSILETCSSDTMDGATTEFITQLNRLNEYVSAVPELKRSLFQFIHV